MNKLEEQIEKRINQGMYLNDTENIPVGLFKLGAQFVIDLELMEKFAEWLTCHFQQLHSGNFTVFTEVYTEFNYDDEYTIKQIKEFWIENIYGR